MRRPRLYRIIAALCVSGLIAWQLRPRPIHAYNASYDSIVGVTMMELRLRYGWEQESKTHETSSNEVTTKTWPLDDGGKLTTYNRRQLGYGFSAFERAQSATVEPKLDTTATNDGHEAHLITMEKATTGSYYEIPSRFLDVPHPRAAEKSLEFEYHATGERHEFKVGDETICMAQRDEKERGETRLAIYLKQSKRWRLMTLQWVKGLGAKPDLETRGGKQVCVFYMEPGHREVLAVDCSVLHSAEEPEP